MLNEFEIDARLIGCWRLVKKYSSGSQQNVINGILVIYGKRQNWVRYNSKTSPFDTIVFSYKVNLETIPNQIDIIGEELIHQGIYKFENDRLMTCFYNEFEDGRPVDFEWSASFNGNVWIYSRVVEIPIRFDGVQIT